MTTETAAPTTVTGRRPARWGALAGVAAAATGLGVAELAAVLTGPRSAPVVAVGGVVVDHVPAAVKDAAIAVFGVHDKTALIVGTMLLLALAAAGVGALAVRSLGYAVGGTALFGAIGVAAALTRPGADAAWALPSLTAVAWSLAAGWFLLRRLPETVHGAASATNADATSASDAGPGAAAAPATDARSATVVTEARATTVGGSASGGRAAWPDSEGRRRFLRSAGLVVAGAAVAGYAGRWLSTRLSVSEVRAAVTLPVPVNAAPALPSGLDPVPDLATYVTKNRDFYRIDTALSVPQVDPESWGLRIHGRVEREITISWADLLKRPMVERYVTLACVSNEVGGDLIGNARWLGVPVKDLLDEAGPLDGADQVVSRSVDGWTCGTPTEILRDGRDALLAIGMNGEPLPVEHGFPVRMVVPGLYGYVSACKWITEIELTSFADFDAYWVPRGWSAKGPIKTQSRIDTPRRNAALAAGAVTVAGVAWAQHVGVAAVEVSVDDGPWAPATLHASVSKDTWCQWTYAWEATPGEHTLRVRATDATGAVQTEAEAPVAPDGATGWHTVKVQVNDG
ncbi:molybdopterin-dependent oxidoreductase [Catenuloplanes atrovinosus]|uniref:DMSO/TMAO reductase YedYZ molybdopterin-dependent catalytic subunit n=1 Tax=Catenuloplanes atrovinosus TaxID=137266 RepID=A0AAE4CCL9_9ACTN|nr:molybdopterin-dependent oxidoreductase [Catenuloplanes atrovinosus]MDR7279387.1 DMSO/TMAO reductase YedYZ molybdopterin-dependent catalytic subunit [Catenuloplanes atrovinosus]